MTGSSPNDRPKHRNRIARTLKIIGFANILIGVINTVNLGNGLPIINLLCGCVLMYGLGRIDGKADERKRERDIHE